MVVSKVRQIPIEKQPTEFTLDGPFRGPSPAPSLQFMWAVIPVSGHDCQAYKTTEESKNESLCGSLVY